MTSACAAWTEARRADNRLRRSSSARRALSMPSTALAVVASVSATWLRVDSSVIGTPAAAILRRLAAIASAARA